MKKLKHALPVIFVWLIIVVAASPAWAHKRYFIKSEILAENLGSPTSGPMVYLKKSTDPILNCKSRSLLGQLQRIESSGLSIAAFFKEYEVPFSRAQYFNYKRQHALSGPAGIQDRRSRGGNRKLSEEAEGFLLGCVKSKPNVTLESCQYPSVYDGSKALAGVADPKIVGPTP